VVPDTGFFFSRGIAPVLACLLDFVFVAIALLVADPALPWSFFLLWRDQFSALVLSLAVGQQG